MPFVNNRGSVALSVACDCKSKGLQFEPQPGHLTFMGVDCELISSAILPLLLILEEQLSVTGESMCTMYWLIAYKVFACPGSVSRITVWLNMTLIVLTGP